MADQLNGILCSHKNSENTGKLWMEEVKPIFGVMIHTSLSICWSNTALQTYIHSA